MKKTVIGAALLLVGSLWSMFVIFFVQNNLVSGWGTPPGRFFTTILDLNLAVPALLAAAMLLVGLAILVVEYFTRET